MKVEGTSSLLSTIRGCDDCLTCTEAVEKWSSFSEGFAAKTCQTPDLPKSQRAAKAYPSLQES